MKTSGLLAIGFCLTLAIALSSPVSAQFSTTVSANSTGTITEGNLNCGPSCRALGVCTSSSSNSAVLMRWNLAVPASATIYSASLSLPVSITGTAGTLPKISIYPIEANWAPITGTASDGNPCTSGAPGTGQPTFESRAFPATAWANPAGSNGTLILSLTPFSNQAGESLTATSTALLALVRSWVANPSTNFGLVAIGPNSTTASAVYLGTPTLTLSTNQAVPISPPVTQVDYTPPTIRGQTSPNFRYPNRYISNSTNAAIIGGVIGGVAVVILVISLITIFLRGGSSSSSTYRYRSTRRRNYL